MQQPTEDFWLSYLRSAGTLQEYTARTVAHNAARQAVALSFKDTQLFRTFLLKCPSQVKSKCIPFLELPETLSVLIDLWHTAGRDNHEKFSELILNDEHTNNQLKTLQLLLDEHSEQVKSAKERTESIASVVTTLEEAQKAQEARKNRTWRDIPEDELAERLSKGEIIGREEWIPGISGGERRKLKAVEAKAHLEFGEQLRNEGNEAYDQGDFEKALLRYTQGVNLLNWVVCEDDIQVNGKLEQMHLAFLKNQSQAALRAQEWRQAQTAALEALKMEPKDEKSLYRLAKAYIGLGEIVSAKNAAVQLLKNPLVTADGMAAGKSILDELKAITAKWKKDVATTMQTATVSGTFAIDREKEDELHHLQKEKLERQQKELEALKRKEPRIIHIDEAPLYDPNTLSYKPRLTVEQVLELLDDLLEAYTEPQTQNTLNKLRLQADFDNTKLLILSKDLVVKTVGPVLDRWEFEGTDYAQRKTAMEKEIGFWRSCDLRVREKARELLFTFQGDLLE